MVCAPAASPTACRGAANSNTWTAGRCRMRSGRAARCLEGRDWGFGNRDLERRGNHPQSPIPHPQSPIPNPHYPTPNTHIPHPTPHPPTPPFPYPPPSPTTPPTHTPPHLPTNTHHHTQPRYITPTTPPHEP